jgi:anti-sigma regulatory factor (Ser/Thr protein kinase)
MKTVLEQIRLAIEDPTQIGEARRRGVELASRAGFEEAETGRVAIVITEVATNLVHHAKRGELILTRLAGDGRNGVEILSIDRGPGMEDVARCFTDGYSTRPNSRGEGLGAIRRLASDFEVDSRLNQGTVLMARIYDDDPVIVRAPETLIHGGLALPFPGETACGDAWACSGESSLRRIMIADGLGHGPEAATASRTATEVFEATATLSIAEVLARQHLVLKQTRGAAVALAEVDAGARTVAFAGVGNVSAVIVGPDSSEHMVSMNGTIGRAVRKIQTFTYALPERAMVVMHSDGLSTHWSFDQYPGIRARHPSVIAGILCRDFRRAASDDASSVVLKEAGGDA